MIVVDGCDLELNLSPCLYVNRRWHILVLLRLEFDDLHLLILRHDWTWLQKVRVKRHKKCSYTEQQNPLVRTTLEASSEIFHPFLLYEN
jgi:hypothetical protein